MKSPFTGGEVKLIKEKRTFEFRKLSFEIIYHYFKCVDTGEAFTNTELDELNTNQVYNQYREKEGIPFPNEITRIRLQYGLSASKMSDILGFGVNMYSKYEAGEIPSVSNGRIISVCKHPEIFKNYFSMSMQQFTSKEQEAITKKINDVISASIINAHEEMERCTVFGNVERGINTGYVSPNLEKARQMVLYFSKRCAPFTTKLNKLLFYSDFLNFSKYGYAISGISYQAIQRGPVPYRYDSLYINTSDIVTIEDVFFEDKSGERFVTDKEFNANLFSKEEIESLDTVFDRFKGVKTKDIVDISHEESAWKENISTMAIIPYSYAFNLKAFEI
jgi:putative zinc finger/helix-turn-helix YgiT family protein